MPYVSGKAVVTIGADGHREVVTSDLVVNPGDKPRSLATSGSDPDVWGCIREGKLGRYETVAHFGGATALFVPTKAIALPHPTLLAQLADPLGGFEEETMIGAVRTTGALGAENCVDTMGGMFTMLDWNYETLAASVKILVFRDDGWVRIVLPPDLASFQPAFDEVQRKRWEVARLGFPQKHEALITFVPMGQDEFNGEPTLVVFGPIGDCQFVRVARLALEGDGYRFCDGEWRNGKREAGEGELVPLRRKIVTVVTGPLLKSTPLILELHSEGHLHQGGLHVFVEGMNRKCLSHNPARVLGPHGLGWLA